MEDCAAFRILSKSSFRRGRFNVRLFLDVVHWVTKEQFRQALFEHLFKIQRFLSQPFFVAAQFTGTEGKFVPVAETVRGFKEILEGKHDDLPEQAFYMVGGIEEVVEKAKKLAE